MQVSGPERSSKIKGRHWKRSKMVARNLAVKSALDTIKFSKTMQRCRLRIGGSVPGSCLQ
uniref:Uncharacterized protein n=2 Tax=Oryza TaxID=4527 RepID=A0A679BAW0_9ORYZ|nr:hypothetical protein [Oryza barthii]BBF89462.1 hypothetical protein [Oryza glaberrima]